MMRRSRSSRKLSAAGVAGALAINVFGVSCGLLGSPKPETPPGFERVEVAGLSLAYPQEWRRLNARASSEDWPRIAAAKAGGQTVAQVAVNSSATDTDDPATAVEGALANSFLHLPGFERVGHRSMEVHGGSAYRVSYVYYLPRQGPDATRKKGYATDIGVSDDSGKTVLVRISGVRPHLDNKTVERIAGSVAVAK